MTQWHALTVAIPKEVHLEAGLVHLLLRGTLLAEDSKGEEAWELQQQLSAPGILCQHFHHLAKHSKQQEGVVRLDGKVGSVVDCGLLMTAQSCLSAPHHSGI